MAARRILVPLVQVRVLAPQLKPVLKALVDGCLVLCPPAAGAKCSIRVRIGASQAAGTLAR